MTKAAVLLWPALALLLVSCNRGMYGCEWDLVRVGDEVRMQMQFDSLLAAMPPQRKHDMVALGLLDTGVLAYSRPEMGRALNLRFEQPLLPTRLRPGRLTGHDFCRDLKGGFRRQGSNLHVSGLTSSLARCDGDNPSLRAVLGYYLNAVSGMRFTHADTLVLETAGGNALVFVRR